MQDRLKILQILTIIVLGVLIIEYSIWVVLYPNPLLAATVAALSTYFSLLWAFFKGSSEGWLQRGFAFTLRLVLSDLRKVSTTLLISGTLSVFVSWSLWNSWLEAKTLLVHIIETKSQPVVEARVIVKNLLSNKELTVVTNQEGLAHFYIEDTRILQTAVSINKSGRIEVATTPVDQGLKLPFIKEINVSEIAPEKWKIYNSEPKPSQINFAGVKTESFEDIRIVSERQELCNSNTNFLTTHLPWGELPADIIICRQPYIVGYDTHRRIPRWVAYKMKPIPSISRDRFARFVSDPLIPVEEQASSEAYRNNPYDRGHMVSRRDVSGYGSKVQAEINYMSVIAPQIDKLNQITWLGLEEYARSFADRYDVWIIAGAAFLPYLDTKIVMYPVIGGNVAVPTHFFRIIVRKKRSENSNLQTLAFLIPNSDKLEKEFAKYLTSIDKLEEVTGLDFFSEMEMNKQKQIEAIDPPFIW